MIAARIGVVVSLFALAGCAGLEALSGPPQTPCDGGRTVAVSETAVSEWRVGDRWIYEWSSGDERGTRTIQVRERVTVNGVAYYVTDIGNGVEHYYTTERHFAAGVQAARVIARMVPPQPWFVWPLRIQGRWTYRGVFEEPQGTKQLSDSFGVVATESVTVLYVGPRMNPSSGGSPWTTDKGVLYRPRSIPMSAWTACSSRLPRRCRKLRGAFVCSGSVRLC